MSFAVISKAKKRKVKLPDIKKNNYSTTNVKSFLILF